MFMHLLFLWTLPATILGALSPLGKGSARDRQNGTKRKISDLQGYWRQSTGQHHTKDPAYFFLDCRGNLSWTFVTNENGVENPVGNCQKGKLAVQVNTTNQIVQHFNKIGEGQREWVLTNILPDSLQWAGEDGKIISEWSKMKRAEVPEGIKRVLEPGLPKMNPSNNLRENRHSILKTSNYPELKPKTQRPDTNADSTDSTDSTGSSDGSDASVDTTGSGSDTVVDATHRSTDSSTTDSTFGDVKESVFPIVTSTHNTASDTPTEVVMPSVVENEKSATELISAPAIVKEKPTQSNKPAIRLTKHQNRLLKFHEAGQTQRKKEQEEKERVKKENQVEAQRRKLEQEEKSEERKRQKEVRRKQEQDDRDRLQNMFG